MWEEKKSQDCKTFSLNNSKGGGGHYTMWGDQGRSRWPRNWSFVLDLLSLRFYKSVEVEMSRRKQEASI
jgi:hypothetical protein